MIELKELYFEVKNGKSNKEIIRNINLNIEEKKFIVVTGPNGGGKSTIAKLIAGIERPTGGKILFNGEDITNLSISDRANLGISFAFQQPVRFKGVNVKDLITLASHDNITVEKACDYLSEVGFCAKDYIDRDIDGSLSGGELKRIEIATVIARNSKLSIFDEPEAGIDLWSFNNLIKVFKKMHSSHSKSIIIISHQERILDIADEIIVVKDGMIVSNGVKEEILPELLKGTDSCKYYKEDQYN
jgi:Fe-S cluster assembly ATP-binding protein